MTVDCRELNTITPCIYAAVPNTAELLDTNLLFSQDKSLSLQLCVLVAQSCPALCDPTDCSLPGFSVHGILQEYWSGLSYHSSEDLPNPGIEPWSPTLQADPLPFELQGSPIV